MPLRDLEICIPRNVLALVYHCITDKPLPYIRHLYNYKTAAEFETDVIYLKNHYHLPTWEEYLRNRGDRDAAKRPSAIITFDDGLSQCFDYVRPILQKQQVPCVFFITKDFVDNQKMFYRHKVSLCVERICAAAPNEQSKLLCDVGRASGIGKFSRKGFVEWIKGLTIINEASIDRACEILGVNIEYELMTHKPYMTTQQIKQLALDGFTIGGHTLHHGPLQHLADTELEQEIVGSCEFVRQLTGTHHVPFAFPFGGSGLDRQVLESIMQRHSSIRFLFDTAGLDLDAPYIINRIPVDHPTDSQSNQSRLEEIIRFHYLDQLDGKEPRGKSQEPNAIS